VSPASCRSERPVDPGSTGPVAWSVVFLDGSELRFGDGRPCFTFHVATRKAFDRILAADAYSAAIAFVRGQFDVTGDLVAAVRFKGWQPESGLRRRWLAVIARSAAWLECAFQGKAQAARHIRFHYDSSNEFYRLFLDPRMVYSCAYFRSADTTLEGAQVAKLDRICRKLDLQPGDRFLDVGCGWGALVEHAAIRYAAKAVGCTLSHAQYSYAATRLDGRARVLEGDYRDLGGNYDKIASVGMFEHVGRRRAQGYFRKLAELLTPDGLYLHHAIARAQGVRDDAASLFMRRYIFPGGQLIHLYEMIRAAEDAGFEVLDVENLRRHYALTCRVWEQRLAANAAAAVPLVGEPAYRAWRIWLAGSALSFEEGFSSVYQVLFGKRSSSRCQLVRDDLRLYTRPAPE